MADKQRIGIGIFGYGFMAQAHLMALAEIPQANVVAVCGPNLAQAGPVAKRHGIEFVTRDPTEMLDLSTVDAVIIATPNDTHFDLAMSSMAAGKHVFVEKPIAISAEEGRRMRAAARKFGIRNMCGYLLRASPLIEKIRGMIESGGVGEILSAHIQRTMSFQLEGRPEMSWYIDPTRNQTGVLSDLGSHAIDLIQYLVGPIDSVASVVSTQVQHATDPVTGRHVPLTLDDDASLIVMFKNGASGTVVTSSVALVDCNFPLGRTSIQVNGSRASILTDGLTEARVFRIGHDPTQLDSGLSTEEADHAGLLALLGERMLGRFLRSILEERDIEPTLTDGLRAQEVVDAAARAHGERRWLKVPQVH